MGMMTDQTVIKPEPLNLYPLSYLAPVFGLVWLTHLYTLPKQSEVILLKFD